LSFLVADDGIGLRESLSENENIQTNKEINPAEVVANRTNVAAQYNETFLNDNVLVISAFLLIMLILVAIRDIHRFRILDDILKDIEDKFLNNRAKNV
jgi:hypothetical protein